MSLKNKLRYVRGKPSKRDTPPAVITPPVGATPSAMASFAEAAEGLTEGQSLVLKLCSGLPLTDIEAILMDNLQGNHFSTAVGSDIIPTVLCFNLGNSSGKSLIAQRLLRLNPDATSIYSPYSTSRFMGLDSSSFSDRNNWNNAAASREHDILVFDEKLAADISTAQFRKMIIFHTTGIIGNHYHLPVAPTLQMRLSTNAMRGSSVLSSNGDFNTPPAINMRYRTEQIYRPINYLVPWI